MTVSFEIGFACRCGHVVRPIVLPQSIQAEISRSLAARQPIVSRLEEFVACPECVRVFVGRASRLRVEPPRTQGRNLQTRTLAIRAHIACATETCGIPVVIHTTANAETSYSSMQLKAATWQIPGGLICPHCHRLLRDCIVGDYVFEGLEGQTPGLN